MSKLKEVFVNKPVVDLRKNSSFREKVYFKDLNQQTQLIWGDKATVKDQQGDWLFIETQDQAFHTGMEWSGYRGWIHQSTCSESWDHLPTHIVQVLWAKVYDSPESSKPSLILSLGSRLLVVSFLNKWVKVQLSPSTYGYVSQNEVKPIDMLQFSISEVINKSRLFLGSPYHWGGRSAFATDFPDTPTGVDCSGLTSLAYRVAGIDIPRDAHDQFLACPQVSRAEVRAGDLVFMGTPKRIGHVLMLTDPKTVIEATMTYNCVREVSLELAIAQRSPEFLSFGRVIV